MWYIPVISEFRRWSRKVRGFKAFLRYSECESSWANKALYKQTNKPQNGLEDAVELSSLLPTLFLFKFLFNVYGCFACIYSVFTMVCA